MYTELEVKALNSIGEKFADLDKLFPISTRVNTGDDVGIPPECPQSEPILWNYFITIAFPIGHKFKMKHKDYCVVSTINPNGYKYVFDEVKYRDCTTEEQYNWIVWKLSRYLKLDAEKWDVFFEHTFEGHIHFHGRLYTPNIKHIKDIKMIFYRMFGLTAKFKYFCDVKVYDDKRWNDYDIKTKKTYQTSRFPHFTNI